jgi:hypothetical protein
MLPRWEIKPLEERYQAVTVVNVKVRGDLHKDGIPVFFSFFHPFSVILAGQRDKQA